MPITTAIASAITGLRTRRMLSDKGSLELDANTQAIERTAGVAALEFADRSRTPLPAIHDDASPLYVRDRSMRGEYSAAILRGRRRVHHKVGRAFAR